MIIKAKGPTLILRKTKTENMGFPPPIHLVCATCSEIKIFIVCEQTYITNQQKYKGRSI